MILLNDGLTPEEKLFELVNSHPAYSASWAERNPMEAWKLIEEIRVANNLQWVKYQILFTQNEVDKLMQAMRGESPSYEQGAIEGVFHRVPEDIPMNDPR